MTYALRKLIAFVFLGGMFIFIYQDFGSIDQQWFMHALGVIALLFGFFWLLIPYIVVKCRIAKRLRQNTERHTQWLAETGGGAPPGEVAKTAGHGLEAGETVYLHEKGTLYVPNAFGGIVGGESREGRPSEVAFPGFNRSCRVIQRVHCYVTDAKVFFSGKSLSWSVPVADVASFAAQPGGLVLVVRRREGRAMRVAYTFQNSLVASDIVRHVMRAARQAAGPRLQGGGGNGRISDNLEAGGGERRQPEKENKE